MTRVTDSQRSKVYRAESVIHEFKQEFETLAECQAFVDSVLARKYVQRHYHVREIHVEFKHHGAATAGTRFMGRQFIWLPRWAWNRTIILHEMAHHLDQYSKNPVWREREVQAQRLNFAPHGPQFCATYLDLVRNVEGKETHDRLKASFKKHKVRFTPRRKKSMTPEQREAARERMAKARAARQEKLAAEHRESLGFHSSTMGVTNV